MSITQRKSPIVIDMPTPALAMATKPRPEEDWQQTAIFVGMIAIVMWAPLALGATEAWSQFVQRSCALALFGLWVTRQVVRDEVELAMNPTYLPTALFGGFVFLQFLTGFTSYRYATLSESLNLLTYGILVLVAGECFVRRRRLKAFAYAMAVYGFAVAVFAILQGFSGTDKIYGLREIRVISAAIYGPYVNHNHFAGLMEMLLPFSAAAAFLEYGPKRVLFLFSTVIMALSIVFSRSRGGMIALAAGFVFVCSILYRYLRNRRGMLGVVAVFAAVIAFTLLLGNDKVFDRLTETQDNYRLAIYGDSLRMALHRPIAGFGLGTFPDVYPAYRSFYTNLLVNHAHNDYLELLVEGGIIGLGLFAWFLTGVFRVGLRKIADESDKEGRLLALAALTGIVSLMVHGLLDFNLHIPANAALFFLLCSAVATPFKFQVKTTDFKPFVDQPEIVGDDDDPFFVPDES